MSDISAAVGVVQLRRLDKLIENVEEWNLESLKNALNKALNTNIDTDKTIEKLRPWAWEPRFRKAVELRLNLIIKLIMGWRGYERRN